MTKAQRIKYGAVFILATVLLVPLFQNCTPYFADPSGGAFLSASSDPMSAKPKISIGTRNFNIAPSENLIASKAYQLSSTAASYSLKLTSIPDSACSISVAQVLTCSYGAVANVTVEEKDARGRLVANHEAVFNVVNPSALVAKGTALYNANCASCHSSLATSTHRLANLLTISNSMTSNSQMVAIPAMASLRVEDLVALEVALNATVPGATPVPSPGAMLYASKCSGCHGIIPNQEHRGTTANQILQGINGRVEMRTPSLQALTPAELDSIATAMR